MAATVKRLPAPFLFVSFMSVMAVATAGCAQRVVHSEEYARQVGEPRPIVLSGSPEADRIAYEDAAAELGPADWAVLEQLGPRPIWDRLGRRDQRYEVQSTRERSDPEHNPPREPRQLPQPQNPEPQGGDAEEAEPAAAAEPTGERLAVTADPADPQEPFSEADLPLVVVELPDDRLRLIWTLRSYGGTQISVDRDEGVARRDVSIEAPDLSYLVTVVEAHLGEEGTVLPLPRENTLVITCPADMRDTVVELLARLDVPPRQVEITAKIFEVSHDFDFQQGAQFLINRIAEGDAQEFHSTFSTQRFLEALDDTAPFQGSVVELMHVFDQAGVTLEASFQLLAESGLIRVVSSPRMTVATGETGYLLAGQELPIQSSTIVGQTERIVTTYKPVGVQLYVTPQAVGEDRIKLHTITVVSAVAGFAPMPAMFGGHNARHILVNPILDSREAETAVTIDDGHTLVISGLRMIRTITRENKVPFLGDLPLLGALFRSHRSQQQMTDLYFFLTPTLL